MRETDDNYMRSLPWGSLAEPLKNALSSLVRLSQTKQLDIVQL